jgi:hypothetical protein
MPEPLSVGDLVGEYLSQPDYQADFKAVEWTIGGQKSWKLERRQHFRESRNESWQAFARGDWEQSLELIEERRESIAKFQARADDLGIGLYRLRVVEQPISPYLQWELHSLNMKAKCGELIRVATMDLVRDFEAEGALPELITLGPSVVYHILYDDDGEPAGAVKVSDPKIVRRATDLTRHLYEAGEDLVTFFERAVSPLPPPGGTRVPRD